MYYRVVHSQKHKEDIKKYTKISLTSERFLCVSFSDDATLDYGAQHTLMKGYLICPFNGVDDVSGEANA